jgi:hypothetical protein
LPKCRLPLLLRRDMIRCPVVARLISPSCIDPPPHKSPRSVVDKSRAPSPVDRPLNRAQIRRLVVGLGQLIDRSTREPALLVTSHSGRETITIAASNRQSSSQGFQKVADHPAYQFRSPHHFFDAIGSFFTAPS